MNILNPWLLLGLLAAFLGVGTVAYQTGHTNGANAQAQADAAKFAQYDRERADQTSEANKTYRRMQDEIITRQTALNQFNAKLEAEREKRKMDIDALRREYAGSGLRFKPKPGSAGHWGGGGSPEGTGSATALLAAPAEIQLPDPIARRLQDLAYDADRLAADYATCYAWATGVGQVGPP